MKSTYYIYGGIPFGSPLTYMRDGTRIHTQKLGEMDCGDRHILRAEFIDFNTGEVTDKFYGSNTDFAEWFTAKAARGDRFDVVVHAYHNAPKLKIPYDELGARMGYVLTKYGTIEQFEDGHWGKMEYEPLETVGERFFLLNKLYANTLNDGEKVEKINRSRLVADKNELIWEAC